MWELIGAGAVALAASALACRVVIAAGVWDSPDLARKAHRDPTPTSGGIGMAIGFCLGLTALVAPAAIGWGASLSAQQADMLGHGVAAGLAGFALGLVDDLRPLGPKSKFALIAAVGLAVAAFVARAESLAFGAGQALYLGAVVGALGSALWVFTLVNAANFMDGANGLSLGSLAIGLVGLAAIAIAHDAPVAAALAALGVGAALGFLIWNFPGGRVFAGDSGALFVGMTAAVAGLVLVQEGGVSAFIPPLLFFPLLADVLLTLAWRTRHRTDLFNGHRDHLFQIGLRAKLPHWRVSVIYWIAAANCAAIAFLASFASKIAPPQQLAAAAGGSGVAWTYAALGAVASLMPVIAFTVVALIALGISKRVRRYAAAHGYDGP